MTAGDFVKDILVPVVTLITATFAGFASYTADKVKTQIENQRQILESQKMEIEKLTATRNVKKLDEDLTFRIYDTVVKSLAGSEKEQKAASTMVMVFMTDEPARSGFLQLFEKSASTPELKSEIAKVLTEERRFNEEQAAVRSTAAKPPTTGASSSGSGGGSSAWGNWDVDVFWCERTADARSQADTLVMALKGEGAKGRVRSRMLPASVNAQTSYGARGLEIRYDSNETQQARVLQQLAEKTFSGSSFTLRQSGQGTPWYLSVFMCPQPGV